MGQSLPERRGELCERDSHRKSLLSSSSGMDTVGDKGSKGALEIRKATPIWECQLIGCIWQNHCHMRYTVAYEIEKPGLAIVAKGFDWQNHYP